MKIGMVFKTGKEANEYWKFLIKDISKCRRGSQCYLYKKGYNYIYYTCKEGEQTITLYLNKTEVAIKLYKIKGRKDNCLSLYINTKDISINKEYLESFYFKVSSLINFLVKTQNK